MNDIRHPHASPGVAWLRRLIAASIALVTLGGVAAPASAAQPRTADNGSIGIQLLEAPTDRADDPRARIYIVDHVAPGTRIERAFEVSNSTSRAQRIQLYVGPATVRDGEFVGDPAGAESELTQWSRLSQPEVELGPGEAQRLQATVQVPTDASEGERYGVIWASVAGSGKGNIQLVNRVGIRVYLSVGPGGEPASDFEIDSLTPGRNAKGRPFVQAQVTNTGGRALDLEGTLRLTDGPGGLSAGPFELSSGTLAPGDSEKLPVVLDKRTPAGPWKARLVMSSGLLEKRATAEITFPDLGKGAAVDTGDDTAWWAGWPFWVGLGLLLLLLMLALAWWLRRRRRDREHEATDEPAVPVGS